MARIEVNIRFLYEGTLFADTFGFIPRHQAIKIAELKVQQNENKALLVKKAQTKSKQPTYKSNKNKKQMIVEEQMLDQNQDAGQMEMQMEGEDADIQNYGEVEDVDEQQDQQQLEQNQNQENQFQNENQNQNQDVLQQDDQIDDQNQDNDLSELSRSISPKVTYGKFKTKRQKGQLNDLLELPLKKPRKDAKKFDQATQLIRKQQKQRKRRQYIKKLNEAQQKATFDKILNETGRKFRQRQERQMKQVKDKDGKIFKTLGDVPKIIAKQTSSGTKIYVYKTGLFSPSSLYEPNVKMSQSCSVCQQNIGKYKTKRGQRFCSIKCYKLIQEKQNTNKMCD